MDLAQIEDFVRAHPAAAKVLGKGGTEQERRENAFRFTNTVAIDLRARGVNAGLLIKTAGVNAFGYSADRLALKAQDGSVNIYDIIGSSEDPTAAVTFGDDGPKPPNEFALPDANLGYVVTTQPPVEPPVVIPPVEPPVDPPDVDLLQLLTDLHTSVLNTERIITQIMPQVDAAFGSIDDRLSRIESAIAAGGGGVAPTYEGSFRILGQTIKFTLTPKA